MLIIVLSRYMLKTIENSAKLFDHNLYGMYVAEMLRGIVNPVQHPQ